jgi:hypothetical protein
MPWSGHSVGCENGKETRLVEGQLKLHMGLARLLAAYLEQGRAKERCQRTILQDASMLTN